jgi:putative oxidoreductase
MLVAVLVIHSADPIAIKEPALHYLLVYLVLVFGGSGKYSIDYLLQRQSIKQYHPNRQPEDPTRLIYQ